MTFTQAQHRIAHTARLFDPPPGRVRSRILYERLDEVSRQRALTDVESHMLQKTMRNLGLL